MASNVNQQMRTRFKAMRNDRGLSLSQAAHKIGCSKGHLHDLESGHSDNPGLNLLRAMSRVYGMPIYWIVGENPGAVS